MTAEEYNELLFSKIKVLNETIWEGKIRKVNITDWLSNFKEEEEKLHALHLLSEFMYFGSTQMRQLLKGIYRDLFRYPIIESIRKNNADTLDEVLIETEFKKEEANTLFFGIGNPSESGAHLLYFFRQENKLSKKRFVNIEEVFDRSDPKNIKLRYGHIVNYIFIDDFCGSGSQVSRDSSLRRAVEEIKRINSKVTVNYLMLFGTTKGIDVVRKTGFFDFVDSVIELDNSFKCFEPNSRYFPASNTFVELNKAKAMSIKYGTPLIKDIIMREGYNEPTADKASKGHCCGFNDCQLLLGFHHNTPDNSLPIIWYDEEGISWRPIFKRYNKKYGF